MKLAIGLPWMCLSLAPAARAAHVAQVGEPAPSALDRSAQGEEHNALPEKRERAIIARAPATTR